MTADGRDEALLWEGPTSYPAPVLGLLYADDANQFEHVLAEDYDRREDAYWERYANAWPFTWQRFINWWIARRWLAPRDIRKR